MRVLVGRDGARAFNPQSISPPSAGTVAHVSFQSDCMFGSAHVHPSKKYNGWRTILASGLVKLDQHFVLRLHVQVKQALQLNFLPSTCLDAMAIALLAFFCCIISEVCPGGSTNSDM